ncbi:glycosyltransferase [Chitinimonas sp.]|uniref:glycosyltransferase n=1 Tax=Chitinimonas sp. TaxID=1934313 RepID=UPI0035B4CAE3
MNVLIACVGSAGDVHPFIAIGQALRQRGHAVTLLTSPYFEERIVRAGLGFAPIGSVSDFTDGLQEADLWHSRRGFAVVCRHVGQHLTAGYQALAALAGPETVLVGSTLAFHARLAQEKLGLPMVSVHLSPSVLFSACAPSRWPGLPWLPQLPAWLARPVIASIERLVLDPEVMPALNALRAELALPPVRRVMSHWLHSPQQVVCAFPDWFAAPQPDWPANTRCSGFPLLAALAGAVLDPLLERFLAAGPPPIVFTPGSAMAHGQAFFAAALAACDAIGRRAVLVTPYRDQLPSSLPAFARHVSYVPFDLLAPRAAAFVHHGGIGTSAQCLAAGVPQGIVPFAHDQFDNAARLKQLGVAEILSLPARIEDWARRLMTLTGQADIAHAAYRLAGQLQGGDAAGQIATLIEQTAGQARVEQAP